MNNIATMFLGLGLQIVIEDIELGTNDKVVFHWLLNGIAKKTCKSQLRYANDGDSYFVTQGVRYYISNFMRN